VLEIPLEFEFNDVPLDVVVANTRAVVPGAIMNCRIVGVLVKHVEFPASADLLEGPPVGYLSLGVVH
jgi:inorganic pyrophosphatase